MENGVHNGNGSVKEKRPRYNVDLLNAIVLYVGMQAIEVARKDEETGVLVFDAKSPQMELFSGFNAELDIEGLIKADMLTNIRPLSLPLGHRKPTSVSK